MGKIRVYKLADELGMESKELVNALQELGIEISSHMSTVEDETADLIRDMYTEESEVSKKDVKKESDEITDSSKEKDIEKSKESTERAESTESKKSDKNTVVTPLTVKEFAEEIDYPANKLIKKLIGLGVMANVNHSLDKESLELLTDELNIDIDVISEEEIEEEEEDKPERVGPEIEDKPEDLELRSPIVTVMGHVDHGKTTLLDMIRKTRVTESEAGGITQHIGAYQVNVDSKNITFIDTPGHEAFTAMRARGAKVTDIAILVVAADDGIMPQTVEAINHAQAADVPIIVAINKIDKSNAQPDRVKQELTEHQLVPEEWGGDTICVELSALKGENIDELLEMILLLAEMEEIKANPDRPGEGVVVEAELDKGRGPVATVLIKNGSMEVGDSLLAGVTSGRIKAMLDETGKRIEKAGPSTPVEILGFSDVPSAGDFVQVLKNTKKARNIAEDRREEQHQREIHQESKVSLEDLYDQIQEGEVKELNVIIKADVQGSIEALKESLIKLSTDEVTVNVIHTGVGAVNETDVNLASASNAIIIGFNVRPGTAVENLADKESVEIRTYRVIYKAIEEIKDAMAGLLDPELKEVTAGRAEVRDTFKVPDIGIIAGVYVKNGEINRNYKVRLVRDGVVIHEGDISSLKRFKDDVREVKEGYECGVGIEGYNDIKVGDILEIYYYKEIKRTL